MCMVVVVVGGGGGDKERVGCEGGRSRSEEPTHQYTTGMVQSTPSPKEFIHNIPYHQRVPPLSPSLLPPLGHHPHYSH